MKTILLSSMLFLSAVMCGSAEPSWWLQRGATNTNPPNNRSVINIGQMKNFTVKAIDEMNARLPGGAGYELNYLALQWNLDHPSDDDNKAVAIGQLKFVASKIYMRLQEVRYIDQLPAWLLAPYEKNNELAVSGQLKKVFDFDFTAPAGQLPAWWVKYYFNDQTGILPDEDEDQDGLTNEQEYGNGTDPKSSDVEENINNPVATYAPELNWVYLSRLADYEYYKAGDPLEVVVNRGVIISWWNEGMYNFSPGDNLYSINDIMDLMDLYAEFPEPNTRWPDNTTTLGRIDGSGGHIGISEGSSATIQFSEQCIRLQTGSAGRGEEDFPVPNQPMSRKLMIVEGNLDNGEYIDGSINSITTYSSTVNPQNKYGDQKIFEQTNSVTGNSLFRHFYTFDFYPTQADYEYCDTTRGELAISIPSDPTKSTQISIDLRDVPKELLKKLKIDVPLFDRSKLKLTNHIIQSDQEYTEPLVFSISGLQPKRENGIAVQLINVENGSVYAQMHVYVHYLVTVPVSIFRIYDRKNEASLGVLSGGSITDEQIVDGLNEAFTRQACLKFILDPSSCSVDLRSPEDEEGASLFDVNGAISLQIDKTKTPDEQKKEINSKIEKILNITKTKHGKEYKRITIHLAKSVLFNVENRLAQSHPDYMTCFGRHEYPFYGTDANQLKISKLIFAHEVGHILWAGLSINLGKDVSDKDHDFGDWPSLWKDQEEVGLMFPEIRDNMRKWIRSTDWIRVNERGMFAR